MTTPNRHKTEISLIDEHAKQRGISVESSQSIDTKKCNAKPKHWPITRKRIDLFLRRWRGIPRSKVPFAVRACDHLINVLDGKPDNDDPPDAPWLKWWEQRDSKSQKCNKPPTNKMPASSVETDGGVNRD